MNFGRRISMVMMVVGALALVGCGGNGGSSEGERVSMGGESAEQATTQESRSGDRRTQSRSRSRSRSSSSSVDVDAVFEETGVYPTNLEVFQDGFAELTLNGQLTVIDIKVPESRRGIVEWPVIPGDRGEENVIWFENFDLKKALDDAIENENLSPNADSQLEITGIRANAYESGSLRGFMDITFNEAFTVKGIKLMQSDGEYWIAWPSIETSSGDYVDLVDATKELKETLIERGRKEMGL